MARTLVFLVAGLLWIALVPVADAGGESFTYVAVAPEDGAPGPHGCSAPLVEEGPVCFAAVHSTRGAGPVTITIADLVWTEVVAYEACALRSGELPSCSFFGVSLVRKGCHPPSTTVAVPEGSVALVIRVFDHAFTDAGGFCGATAGTIALEP